MTSPAIPLNVWTYELPIQCFYFGLDGTATNHELRWWTHRQCGRLTLSRGRPDSCDFCRKQAESYWGVMDA